MTRSLALSAWLLAVMPDVGADLGPSMPALREELLHLIEPDQDARRAHDAEGMRRADEIARPRLKKIIEKHGWPTISMVGEDGAQAAWLIAQHSDLDPDFQQAAAALMEPLVEKREASAKLLAYLHDRTHRPQRYGTQGRCTAKGVWTPYDIEDAERVDERRASVGMQPEALSEYARMVGSMACK